jgi:hypothetical protein
MWTLLSDKDNRQHIVETPKESLQETDRVCESLRSIATWKGYEDVVRTGNLSQVHPRSSVRGRAQT